MAPGVHRMHPAAGGRERWVVRSVDVQPTWCVVRQNRDRAGHPHDRRRAAALTVLTALLFTVPTALTLVARWAVGPTYAHTNPVVHRAFFALGGILVTAGLASQIRGLGVAGLQGALLALFMPSFAGWWGGRIEPFVGGLVLLAVTAPLLGLHPDRSMSLAWLCGVATG